MAMLHQAYERGRSPRRTIRLRQTGKEATADVGEAQIQNHGVDARPERALNGLDTVCGQFNLMSMVAEKTPHAVS